jgi:hypothetical protein
MTFKAYVKQGLSQADQKYHLNRSLWSFTTWIHLMTKFPQLRPRLSPLLKFSTELFCKFNY